MALKVIKTKNSMSHSTPRILLNFILFESSDQVSRLLWREPCGQGFQTVTKQANFSHMWNMFGNSRKRSWSEYNIHPCQMVTLGWIWINYQTHSRNSTILFWKIRDLAAIITSVIKVSNVKSLYFSSIIWSWGISPSLLLPWYVHIIQVIQWLYLLIFPHSSR